MSSLIVPTKKINYLNNRDILKEIHKSKTTYCVFTKPEYADYDIIIRELTEIPELLKEKTETRVIVDEDTGESESVTATFPPEALAARATRLTRISQELELMGGKKPRSELAVVSVGSIKPQDIIFRLMTWDHIPIAAPTVPKVVKGKKAKQKAESVIDDPEIFDDGLGELDADLPPALATPTPKKYVKVNFPSFQHYKLDDNLVPQLVGKSHWKGDINTGEFCRTHGQITNKLAIMYMKLCERYVTRSNWRGYSYRDEMQAQAILQLTQVGLQFDESKSQNPFAYYTSAITNSFTRVLNIEKQNQNIRDDILEMNSLNPSYTRQGTSSNHSYDSTGDYD